MRIGLACVFVSVLIGCGGSSSAITPGGDDGDDQPKIDAGIDADLGLQPPAQGFQFHSPEIDVAPGDDVTWCYYLHLPTTADVEIQKWESELTEGVQGVVLYTTSTDLKAQNSLTQDPCGYSATNAGPIWAYQTQTDRDQTKFPARDQVTFPASDNNGQPGGLPVGFPIHANQPAYLQIHLVNPGTTVLHTQVKINGNTYDAGKQVTEAGPFITYSSTIQINPGTPTAPATGMVTASCKVPTTVKFFAMSTHTFRHGSRTVITDTPAAGATTTVFEGTNWQLPNAVSAITAANPHTFSGKLTYRCEYTNTEGASLKTGDNAKSDEMCLTVGYFFPSPGGTGGFCLDGLLYN